MLLRWLISIFARGETSVHVDTSYKCANNFFLFLQLISSADQANTATRHSHLFFILLTMNSDAFSTA